MSVSRSNNATVHLCITIFKIRKMKGLSCQTSFNCYWRDSNGAICEMHIFSMLIRTFADAGDESHFGSKGKSEEGVNLFSESRVPL